MKGTLMVLALLGTASAGSLLTDFSSKTLRWVTVNDNVMGGRSQGGFKVDGGQLVFTGSTNTNGGGFSSIRSRPQELGLEGCTGIHLRVRGDGRTYTFRVSTSGSRASYWSDFATKKGEWVEVKLPFDSFRAQWRGRKLDMPSPDPKRIVSLGLMIYDKRDGAFKLEVDWIKAYGSFSLQKLEWKRRPLVVFAPSADDPRIQKQVAAVRAAAAGCKERDMQLVVVPQLSKSSQDAVRRKLKVGAGTFSVCLVGKDGEVKWRSDEPVAMDDVFSRIDLMPMRRAEIEDRRRN